jgi:hypothetical protein
MHNGGKIEGGTMSETSNRPLKLNDTDIERIRALWDEDIASGSAGNVDFPTLRAEARKRLLEFNEDNGKPGPASS